MPNKARLIWIFAVAVSGFVSLSNAVNLITNSGFEISEPTSGGLPSVARDWKGDYSEIVSAKLGITPLSGSKMLQFKGTSYSGYSSSDTCQVYQIIDVSSCYDLIRTGHARATAKVYFNRVAGDAQTDTVMGYDFMAFDGTPSSFPSRWSSDYYNAPLAYHNVSMYCDSSASTWQFLETTMSLPRETTFLVICLKALENVYNESSSAEFDGHFADNVSVEVIPEPATVSFLLAAAGLLRRKGI